MKAMAGPAHLTFNIFKGKILRWVLRQLEISLRGDPSVQNFRGGEKLRLRDRQIGGQHGQQ